jgi:branched-chain amino acid transport system permease protein
MTAVDEKAEARKKRSLQFGPFYNRMESLLPGWAWALIFLAVAILFGMFGQDVFSQDFYDAMITTLAFVMMALGLNIVVGFAGLLDLGYVAFYAIGAFVAGWFMSGQFSDSNVHIAVSEFARSQPGIHINFFVVIFAAGAFTALWGAILGAPTLRLRGDYLAIVTLAFGEIVPRVFELSTSGPFGIGNLDLSNGRQGITPVDRPWLPISGLDHIGVIDIKPYYFIVLAMVCLVLFCNIRLRDSRLGRAWIAVREDEVAAAAMGVNLVRVKLWAYAMGAAIGGFAGAFLGVYRNTVNVDQFEFSFSVFVLCMVIIGGMGNIAGVILGAFVLSMIDRFVLPELNGVPDSIGLDFDVTAISGGIFGFFLLSMMVLRPEGFLPNRRRRIELHEGEAEAEGETLVEARA